MADNDKKLLNFTFFATSFRIKHNFDPNYLVSSFKHGKTSCNKGAKSLSLPLKVVLMFMPEHSGIWVDVNKKTKWGNFSNLASSLAV